MILSRSPVRFSLGGGGTDLPSYCDAHGGFLVAAAIDKYIYVAVNRRFYPGYLLKYAKTEQVDRVDDIHHPLFREALKIVQVPGGVELVSIADLPANSGLGSSSAFTVALVNALHAYRREFVATEQLAREACQIEIDILKEPIGKQDQYISAYGGITAFTFEPGGGVTVERVPMGMEVVEDLEMNLLVFYSGIERKASDVLSEQKKTIKGNKDDAVERMHRIKALGYETKRILMTGAIDQYGDLLHEHWMNKRKLASNMTDGTIDEHYEVARGGGHRWQAHGGRWWRLLHVLRASREPAEGLRGHGPPGPPAAPLPLRLRRRAHQRELPA